MMRALYIAKTGMESSSFKLDTLANNLANVNTRGFKKTQASFEDLYYQTLRQPGSQLADGSVLPTGLQVGTGSTASGTARIFSDGNLSRTEQPFDLAITGSGFFKVLMPDGTPAYTRNGEFHRTGDGNIANAQGYALDPKINVPGDASGITISDSGLIQYRAQGSSTVTTAGTIQLANFTNPQGLESLGQNLFRETSASGTAQEGDPTTGGRGAVKQGFLEDSNVNVTEELINMIQSQRSFEMNSRAIKTADEMLQKISQL